MESNKRPVLAELHELQRKVLDVKYGRIPLGLGLNVPEIDEYLRFKRGNFNICVGHANTGKTTAILYLMLAYSVKHDLKWVIYSSENNDYDIARKLIEFKTGTTVQQLPDAVIAEEFEWVDRHFKLIKIDEIMTAKQLLNQCEQIYEEWIYDGLFIDPYNSLAKDPTLLRSIGAHEYDYQIASEMRLFAKKNDVTIWLNAHAVTEALRRVYPADHEFAGMPKPCSLADIEGGGKWGNRADDVVSLHRMTQHPTKWVYTEIHVKKVKDTESGGCPTPFESPILLRMEKGNTRMTINGRDIVDTKNYQPLPKTIEF